MTSYRLIGFILLTMLLPIIVSGRRCHCTCKKEKSRAVNAEKELAKATREIEMLRKNIVLGKDFALSVSTQDGTFVGYINDEYNPSMNLPPNSKMHIVQRITTPTPTPPAAVRLYYDVDQKGLFMDLPAPGQYNASQIRFPPNSVSSIDIPTGYQVVMYAEDDFKGEHVVLSSSTHNFDKFNDKMRSIEIMEQFMKKPEHMAVAYSHHTYSGKQQGLILGENTLTSKDELKSISIQSGYEVLIYATTYATTTDAMTLIEIISASSNNIILNLQANTVSSTLLQAVVQSIPDFPTPYAKLHADVDFKGFHFFVSTTSHLDGSLSSIQIPSGYEAVLYDQPTHHGTYVVLSGEINNLNFYAFNDRAKSIIVRPTTSREDVAIYSKPNYIGEKLTLPVGRSDCSFVKLLNFCHEAYAGSIKVPTGFKVILTKTPTPLTNNERVYTYFTDSPEIRNYIDTLIMSVVVEHV